MTKIRITTTLAAALLISSASLVAAQTTLKGDAKDNSPEGRRENVTKKNGTSESISAAPATGAGTGESKLSATGGQPGGRADKN